MAKRDFSKAANNVSTNDVSTADAPNIDEIKIDVDPIEEAKELVKMAEDAYQKAKSDLIEAKKALAKLSGKKSGGRKSGSGVIATIFSLVSAADQNGISKADILDKLIEMFPERAAEGMEKTINVQLPKRMSRERDVEIVKSESGGFYVKR